MNYRILGDSPELYPLSLVGKYRTYLNLHGERDRIADRVLIRSLLDPFFNHPNIVFANANNPRLKDVVRQAFLTFPEMLEEQITLVLSTLTNANGMLLFFSSALTTPNHITLFVGAMPDSYLGLVRKIYIDEIFREL